MEFIIDLVLNILPFIFAYIAIYCIAFFLIIILHFSEYKKLDDEGKWWLLAKKVLLLMGMLIFSVTMLIMYSL